MRKVFLIATVSLIFNCCKHTNKEPRPSEGMWLAELKVLDGHKLPFIFRLVNAESGNVSLEIFNAKETIPVDEIEISNDSIIIRTPVFEGYLAGIYTENSINGQFIIESLDRYVPFQAKYGEIERFQNTKPSLVDITGIWETVFSSNTDTSYIAKGNFTQVGKKVTGTFETTTGDYRYLEGVVSGDSLKLSTFDGAHAFLFLAKASDSTLNGTFYSGNHFKEPFVAKRNESFELPNSDSLTYLNEGFDTLIFTFPDAQGNIVSLKDSRFKNKVVLVQIMGSWCPNCLDETKFYVDYLNTKAPKDLEIIGLAFEYAKTKEEAFERINRLKERIGVAYPILLAQYGTSDKNEAQQKLPMLNHVLSYPTTIYIDKKGKVRKVHTGFNGPATGEKFTKFKSEFDTFVNQLITE